MSGLRCDRCGAVKRRNIRETSRRPFKTYGMARGVGRCANARICGKRRARKHAAIAAHVQQVEDGRARKAERLEAERLKAAVR